MTSKPTPIKAVAFDFDGTLADSFSVFVRAAEVVLKRSEPYTAEEINNLRQHSLREIIAILQISRWQLPGLLLKGMKEVERRSDDIAIFDGIAEMLRQLQADGYTLFIVSSHSALGINNVLQRYGLTECFTAIYPKVGLWGKPKYIRKLMQQYGYSADQLIYVGDEVRDIEASKRAGVECYAVTWGFNPAMTLASHAPAVLLEQPAQLNQLLSKHDSISH